MASVGGVSSNNATSSLFNSANIISGLASGLDTEGMIESLVKSYQTKLDQLNQQATKIEWKQDAYRSIIQKMVGFSNKYTSYTSSTNLSSPSFFSNAIKVLTKGVYADSVTASGKTSSDISLNSVSQLATGAQYRTKSEMVQGESGTIAGESMDLFKDGSIELSNLSGSLTLTYGAKTISLSFNETSDVEAMKDIRKNLARDEGLDEDEVTDQQVLAGLINQKLADQQIVFTNGNSESADQRIKAVVNSDKSISLVEKGTGQNGVYISKATGNIAENLGLSEDELKNASKEKPTTLTMSSDGLTRKMSGVEYLAVKSHSGVRQTMNISLDGSTKQINMPTVSFDKDTETYWINGKEVEGEDSASKKQNFINKYTEALKSSVKDAFGDKVTVENKGNAEKGELKLEFKVKNEGSELTINSDIGNALGIGKTATSYLNTSKTLGDLLGDKLNGLDQAYERDENGYVKTDDNDNPILAKDSKGNPMFEFKINGVSVGNFSKNSKLSEVLDAINASDAGVKAAYSQATQSFTFTSKETGADSKIEMGKGLAQTMFGSTEVSGKSPKFAEAYGAAWLESGEVSIKTDKGTVTVSGSGTVEDVAGRLNDLLKNFGQTASYNKYTGQLDITDANGAKVDFTIEDSYGDKVTFNNKYAPKVSYTPGQDAKFSVTINGETMNMTRSSNNVTIDGLTFTMNETFNGYENKDGTPAVDGSGRAKNAVTFQSKTDSDKIVDAIKTMAEEYNTMMTEIKSAYTTMPYRKSSGAFANYEPLTDEERDGMSESAIERYEAKAKQGILFGDRNLSNLYTRMSQVFSFANTRDTDTLKDMGLELTYNTTDGSQALVVNEEKLRAYLDSNPERVQELFTKNDGIMDRMKNQLDTYSKTTGEPKGILVQQAGTPLSSLSLLNNQWQKELDNISSDIEKWQDKLEAQVEKYTSQFSRLEQLINQMNSQSSALAGLMGG